MPTVTATPYTVVQASLASDGQFTVKATVMVPTSGKLLGEFRLQPDDPLERLLDQIRGGAENIGVHEVAFGLHTIADLGPFPR